MSQQRSRDGGTAPPWSPENESRPEMRALIALRRPLTASEGLLCRRLFEAIYAAYFDDVWSTLLKWHVRGDDMLADLTQETFMRLWKTTVAEGFPDVIVAKLRGLAMGVALNLGRRERRSPVTDRGIPSSGSEKPATSGSHVDAIDGAIDVKEVVRTLFHALSPDHRRVIDAVVFRDLSQEDAGTELGLAQRTVGDRVTAAFAKLRELAPELLSPSQRTLR